MSLTSFLEEIPDVRERFQQEFKKPKLVAKRELIAPPLTTNYSLVGTAFDYLFRFYLQHLNPNTVARDYWVADIAVERLAHGHDSGLYVKSKAIVATARKNLDSYLLSGKIEEGLIISALRLATLDPIARAGRGHEMVGLADKGDGQDLKNLISAIDSNLFASKNLCLLNPTFGLASELVGGADADLVIDDTIIDIETTKNLTLDRRAFNQVLGYYILHQISGVSGLSPKPTITKIAIYFPRFGYLHVMPISELINPSSFPEFVQWFQGRSTEIFSEC